MKAYLWHRIDECTDAYHPEGGVVIVAESLERAREIAFLRDYSGKATDKKMSISSEPDAVFEAPNQPEKIWVFPDSGCC